ncbi:23643_t:CDS:2, partial [Dentiscutata erythropus]
MIPIENLGFLNTKKIWVASVKEQFDYCYQYNLAHVWAYLYTECTMAIKSHWWVLKHDFFSNFNNARLDLIIYIIVSKVIPCQADRLQLLHDGRCMPKWREEFLVEWKKLSNKIITNNPNRITDPSRWICSCPSFLLNQFYICKHLMQIRNPVEFGFFKK